VSGAARTLLVIANGHGEDAVAARVVGELLRRAPWVTVEALPVVGEGGAIARSGARLAGPHRELPSGGLTFHAWGHLLADLRAGILSLTARQAAWLLRARPDAVFAVGDFYAQLLAGLVRAPRRVLQTLVSVHAAPSPQPGRARLTGRYFMEAFRGPELALMRGADRVYARDAATAAHLAARGVAGASYVGNPMMDGLAAPPLVPPGLRGRPTVGLLPGTRSWAGSSVTLMISALERLPGALGLVAWTHGQIPAPPAGWESDLAPVPGVAVAWRRGPNRLWWVVERFAAVLASADVVLGTAGTGNEQAVGLGIPTVAFPVPPHLSSAFIANQARLLGEGLTVGEPDAAALAAHVARLARDGGARARAAAAGSERMGGPGASAALAGELAAWLEALPRR
jgi:uncharacterized protein (TIGR03492 family)